MAWKTNRMRDGYVKMSVDLIQFSGSFSQSMLQRNLSQASHPIGGVNDKPFSSEYILLIRKMKTNSAIFPFILIFKLQLFFLYFLKIHEYL